MRSSFAFNKPERAESYVDSQFLSSPTAQTGEASPSFYRDASDLGPPVKLISATKIYPWGKEDSAKPMVFPDASAKPANMIWPDDASAFEMYCASSTANRIGAFPTPTGVACWPRLGS